MVPHNVIVSSRASRETAAARGSIRISISYPACKACPQREKRNWMAARMASPRPSHVPLRFLSYKGCIRSRWFATYPQEPHWHQYSRLIGVSLIRLSTPSCTSLVRSWLWPVSFPFPYTPMPAWLSITSTPRATVPGRKRRIGGADSCRDGHWVTSFESGRTTRQLYSIGRLWTFTGTSWTMESPATSRHFATSGFEYRQPQKWSMLHLQCTLSTALLYQMY